MRGLSEFLYQEPSFASVVGRPKMTGILVGMDQKDCGRLGFVVLCGCDFGKPEERWVTSLQRKGLSSREKQISMLGEVKDGVFVPHDDYDA